MLSPILTCPFWVSVPIIPLPKEKSCSDSEVVFLLYQYFFNVILLSHFVYIFIFSEMTAGWVSLVLVLDITYSIASSSLCVFSECKYHLFLCSKFLIGHRGIKPYSGLGFKEKR